MFLLKVVVEHSNYSLNEIFYYVSDTLIYKGTRVYVNFNNQKIIAFVLECIHKDGNLNDLEKELGFELKYIDEVIDKEPIINDELFSLAFELSNRYFYPLIGTFKTMLPSSLRPGGNLNSKPKIHYDEFYVYEPNNNLKYNKLEQKTLSKFTIFNEIECKKINKSKTLEDLISKGVIKKNKKRVL